jgi:protein SCO1/2
VTGRDLTGLVSGLALAGLTAFGFVSRATSRSPGPTPATPPAATAPERRPVPSTPTSTAAGSVYNLGVEIVGSDGARHGLDELRGHPVLASMFYSTCPIVCPTLITDMRRVEAALPAGARNETRMVLVSFDPERDQPAVLRDVLARHRLDARRWLVATAKTEDAARTLAAALGIRYRPGIGGSFEHTTRIALLDREGRLRATVDDTATAATKLGPLIDALVGSGS